MNDIKIRNHQKSVLPSTGTHIKSEEINLQDVSHNQTSQTFDKLRPRRNLAAASPKVSIATIPKEFVIDTSELRAIPKKVLTKASHTKSQYWSPSVNNPSSPPPVNHGPSPFELPITTYDENYSFNNSRQTGSYKWSLWKLQQTKVNVWLYL